MPIGIYPRKDSQLSAAEFFAAHSEKNPNGCIEWKGAKVAQGYAYCPPRYNLGKYIHRAVASLKYGPIPFGMVVLHHCDNKRCINPDHLSIGTQRENVLDAVSKGRINRKRKFSQEYIDMFIRFHSYGVTVAELSNRFKMNISYCYRLINNNRVEAI